MSSWLKRSEERRIILMKQGRDAEHMKSIATHYHLIKVADDWNRNLHHSIVRRTTEGLLERRFRLADKRQAQNSPA